MVKIIEQPVMLFGPLWFIPRLAARTAQQSLHRRRRGDPGPQTAKMVEQYLFFKFYKKS
jgi:hypothetical protein